MSLATECVLFGAEAREVAPMSLVVGITAIVFCSVRIDTKLWLLVWEFRSFVWSKLCKRENEVVALGAQCQSQDQFERVPCNGIRCMK